MRSNLKGWIVATTMFATTLLSITFLCGCGGTAAPPVVNNDPAGTAKLYDGTYYGFSVVSCASGSAAYKTAVNGLCDGLAEITGKEISSYDDAPGSNGAVSYEIMVGSVDRAAAEQAFEEIEYDFTYSIEVTKTAIIIAGSTEKYVISGIEYFKNTYLSENVIQQSGSVFIKTGSYVAESAEPSWGEYINLKTAKKQSIKTALEKAFVFAPNKFCFSTDKDTVTRVQQGSCLSEDGKYMFTALNGGSSNNRSSVHKVEIATGNIVASYEDYSFDWHANSITLVPDENAIAVVHNVTGNLKKVTYLSSDNLKHIKDVNAAVNLHSLAYSPERQQYVAGISGSKDEFAVLDKELKQVGSKFSFNSAGGTHQGGDCDGEYIYFVQSVEDKSGNGTDNLLITYDWNGNFIAKTTLPQVWSSDKHEEVLEVEDMTHVGNVYYFSFYRGYDYGRGGVFYRFEYEM